MEREEFAARVEAVYKRLYRTAYLYLGIGALLALLEQELWDKLKHNHTSEE